MCTIANLPFRFFHSSRTPPPADIGAVLGARCTWIVYTKDFSPEFVFIIILFCSVEVTNNSE